MWKSQADAAEQIFGNRKNNNGLYLSLNSPNNNKLQANEWYLFRDKNDALSDWKPAERNIFTTEKAKKAAAKSAEKTKKPVYGVNIKTEEVVKFDSLLSASYFIKGEGDRSATSNIHRNIQRIKNGETWCYAFGYRWYYV